MEKVLLFILTAASVWSDGSSVPDRVYQFVDQTKNWTEAQSYCREHYKELATIENMEDVTKLNNMIKSLGKTSRAWIGLYDDVNSWRWSMLDSAFYQNDENKFRNWSPGQPNNYLGKESCGEMLSNGSWNDDNCSFLQSSVCMTTSGLSVTFHLINTSMTWTDAQSYCRKHHTDLASVRNMSENQMVKGLVPKGQQVWTGLFRDTWKWSDGRNSSFRNWKSGEPNNNANLNETCALANFEISGKWEDWNCNNTKAFICYTVPVSKQVVRLKLEGSSSLDLSDPAVQEDLLRKLKQKLKDNGVNEDVRLSWRKQSDGQIFYKEKEEDKKKGNTEL